MTHWTADEIPSLVGRTALVTGANSGIGFETAAELARHGAQVYFAARSADKAQESIGRLRAAVPGAEPEFVLLDLADLDSVAAAANHVLRGARRLDLLVNNAGVMAVPKRMTTAQGFELQIGTNHIGHFALTGYLLPLLLGTDDARVVTVSSIAHKRATVNLDDLDSVLSYSPMGAYRSSKLANVLFFTELDRRLRAAGRNVLSVGAHPGLAATNLGTAGQRATDLTRSRARVAVERAVLGYGYHLISQSAAKGALPSLFAATAPGVLGGQFFGPSGPGELWGAPRARAITPAGRNVEMARRLFEQTIEVTGVSFAELN